MAKTEQKTLADLEKKPERAQIVVDIISDPN
jgi:hypothetical protein